MRSPPTNIAVPGRAPGITVLSLIFGEAEHAAVHTILQDTEWIVRRVRTGIEMLQALHHCHSPVVICETRLPDGDWRDLFTHLGSLDNPPNLILLSEHDITLAAEFLNLGGFDVLEKPLDRSECLHACAAANRNWTARAQRNHSDMAD